MARRQEPAPNAVAHTVTDYAPDPNGWHLVAALQRRIASTLNGGLYIGPRTGEWSGWTQQLQQFRGHAGGGAARVYAPKSSTIQEQATGQSVAAAIFLDRAGSGR